VSALVKLSGATLAAIVSKTLKCGFASLTRALFMLNIRGSGSFSFSLFFHISSNSSKLKLRIAVAHRDRKRFIVRADEKADGVTGTEAATRQK
jgi:hypothetical protein